MSVVYSKTYSAYDYSAVYWSYRDFGNSLLYTEAKTAFQSAGWGGVWTESAKSLDTLALYKSHYCYYYYYFYY